MIANLHIKNIGIIDDVSINLNNGFNVLTGETGAGKTLIIDSLTIIAGGRFSKEMIRKGQDHSYVELCLYLPKHAEAIDGNIILSREIYLNGRNLCKINGRMVTVNELKDFMKEIIDIHGQKDNQTLLETSSHIDYLDSFAAQKLKPEKEEYYQYYQKYKEIQRELKNNYGNDKEKQRKLDLLRYEWNEINVANLKEGEDEKLEEQRNKMLNSEKITENLKQVVEEVEEKAIDSISTAVRALEKIENLDERYAEKLNFLKSAYYDLQELSREFNSFQQEIEFDEQERQEVEKRLDLVFSMKRKYGNSIEEIDLYKEQISKEIDEIENKEEIVEKLKQEEKQITKKMHEIANKMHEIRRQAARELENKINEELIELEMKNATFSIQIKFDVEKEFLLTGLDQVEFFISTNIGEESKPLIKIASGGEMSRIMLAIKKVLTQVDKIPILIFDEIDTGISGIAANKVAEKMKQIAKHHQVICVSHLAAIAAKGDYHYYIKKEVVGQTTKTTIKQLEEEEIIKEIARISGGEITKVALEHARELRK